MTDVALEEDVRASFERILATCRNVASRSSFGTSGGTVGQLQALFRARHGFWLDAAVQEIVLEHALRAERTAPGSLDRFLGRLTEEGWQPQADLEGVTCVHPAPSRADVEGYVRSVTSGAHLKLASMVMDALDLAGMNGRIIVERTNGKEHVEHVSGCSFPLRAVNARSKQLSRPFVACLDAVFDRREHIVPLLEQVKEAGITCALFARGFSDEVVAITTANDVNVTLVKVPIEYETVNTLSDVAVIAGCDVLSVAKGEEIGALNVDNLRQLDRIDVMARNVVLFNQSTVRAVRAQRDRLLRRIAEEDDAMTDYLKLRVRSLGSNTVYVRLHDDATYVERAQLLDTCLRGTRAMIGHGVKDGMPGLAHAVGTFYANRCRRVVSTLGAAVKER